MSSTRYQLDLMFYQKPLIDNLIKCVPEIYLYSDTEKKNVATFNIFKFHTFFASSKTIKIYEGISPSLSSPADCTLTNFKIGNMEDRYLLNINNIIFM